VDALSPLLSPLVVGLTIVAYLAGSIPFGLVLARLVAGKDVRAAGSGNIGATNVARVVGKKLGAVTLVLDAAKGALPVLCARTIELPPEADRVLVEGIVGLAALVGHCFPLWLKLRGGKGVATGLGVLLALRWELALLAVLVFGLTYAVTRVASVGSLAAAVAVIGVLVVSGLDSTSSDGGSRASMVPLLLCFAIIVVKHRTNLARLWKREELKV
jgi:glycerol-3-phosphate acyltransferase PlsY